MKHDKKFLIWSNWNLDIDDDGWKDYWDELADEYGEELTDNEKWDRLYDEINWQLDDERENLNIKLEDEIIVLGDIGRWDGRVRGYKLISSGNIRDCLSDDCDYCTWYCDRYNFRFDGIHHDGTNHYLYRQLRPELTWEQRDNFLWKLRNEAVSDRTIRRYTKSIRPEIAKVYGWR